MNSPQSDAEKAADLFEAALEMSDRGVERFYTNGFVMAVTATDISLLFKQNDKAVSLGAMSYGVAKDLAMKLTAQLAEIEKATSIPIIAGEEMARRMQEAATKGAFSGRPFESATGGAKK